MGLSGLVVLDRDDHSPAAEVGTEAELEVFVWSLRHIESYLLVPAAIRRMLRLAPDDTTVERSIAESARSWVQDARGVPGASEISATDEGPDRLAQAHGAVHAKRILGAGGSLSEALGVELHAGEIARAMRVEDLHQDVHTLFDRIGVLCGLAPRGPEVVIRRPSPQET